MASTTASTSHIISNWHMGADADGVDLKVFGDTTGNYLLYDASLNRLLTSGTGTTFYIGAHHSTTAGSGTALAEAGPGAAVRFYADDGGAVIATATGSVPDVKNLLVRTLITQDNSAYDLRLHSIMGQLKAVNAEWGDEQVSAVHGYLELVRTAGTRTLQSYGVTAGLMATVETAGDLGVAVTHNLAGVAAISKLGYSGTFTDNTNTSGLYVGIYDSTNWSDSPTLDKWNHGVYIQAAAADKGLQIGELSSTTQTGLTLVTASGYEGVSVYCDDGNVALTGGTPFAGIHSRTMFFKDQANGTTVIGSWGQLKYYSGVDIGPARVAAVEGYNELLTTNIVKSGGTLDCVRAEMEGTAGTFTVNSGGVATGFHANMTGAATFTQDSGGILAGLKVGTTATTGVWGYGVFIAAGAAVTGIYVGTTSGTGINYPAGATYGKALAYGEFGTPIAFGDDEPFEIHGRLDANAKTKPLMRVRCSTPDGVAMTTGEVHAIQAQAYNTSTSDAAVLEAVQGHVGIKANAEVIADIESQEPNMRAAWFKIEDLGFDLTLTGTACVLNLGMQWNAGTTLTGNCDWIKLVKKGSLTDPADAMIRVYDGAGGGWATYLLDVPVSLPVSVDAGTPSANSTHKIACRIGGTTAYIALYADY